MDLSGIDPGSSGEPATTAVELFLDTIAHEVRTPLAIAKMAATTVVTRQELDEAERERLLAVVVRNTDLALLLLDRMNLAKDVESNAVHLLTEAVDLTTLVAETVGDLRLSVLEHHPVEVVGSSGVMIEADATAVREILLNLLLNAAKYSPDGAPIEVVVAGDSDEATVAVRDRGDGIAEADLEHMFGKYVQKRPGGGGVGLGLYISRGLARAHGGDLVARAGLEEGSEFVVRFPVGGPGGESD